MTDPSLAPFLEACAATTPLRVEVQSPGGKPAIRDFSQPFLVIGRDPKADLPFDHPAVSHRHAYLQVIAGRVFYVDLFSRTGVRRGNRLFPAGWLTLDEPIGIGPFTLRLLTAPALPAAGADVDPLASRPRDRDPLPPVDLEIYRGGQKKLDWQMNRALALVGQESGCKVRLTGRGVSSVHCGLLRTPHGLWVIDLLSSTGTFVNKSPVRWSALAEGDELRVGEIVLRIRHHSASTSSHASLFLDEAGSVGSVRMSGQEEQFRAQVTELEQALIAAKEAHAGAVRAGEEAAARWAVETQALQVAELQARESAESMLATTRGELESAQRQLRDLAEGFETKWAQARQESEREQQALRDEAEQIRKQGEARVGELEAARADAVAEKKRSEEASALAGQEFAGELHHLQTHASELREQLAKLRAEETAGERQWHVERAQQQQEFDRQLLAIRDEADRLREENQQSSARNATAASEIETLHSQLTGAQADAAEWEKEWQTELAALREQLALEERASREQAEALRGALDQANTHRHETNRQAAALQAELEAARSQSALECQRHEDDRAQLMDEFAKERQTLGQEVQDLGSKLSAANHETAAQTLHRQEEAAAAQAEFERKRNELRGEIDRMRRQSETDRMDMAQREQQWQAEREAARTEFESESTALRVQVDGLRQEREILQHQLDLKTSEHERWAMVVEPTPAHQAIAERFRKTVERFNQLVDELDSLRVELSRRSQERQGAKRGVLSRLRGGSDKDAEGDNILERRLASLRGEATGELQRTALAAAEAARADLEQQLAVARRQIREMTSR